MPIESMSESSSPEFTTFTRFAADGTPPGGGVATPEAGAHPGDLTSAQLRELIVEIRQFVEMFDPTRRVRQTVEAGVDTRTAKEKETDNLRYVMDQMTRLEGIGVSYNQMVQQREFQLLQSNLQGMDEHTRHYFYARIQVYEAGRTLLHSGGSIEAFNEVGKMAGGMHIAEAMFHVPEVAQAYSKFERLSKLTYLNPDGSIRLLEEKNPDGSPKRTVDNKPIYVQAKNPNGTLQFEKTKDENGREVTTNIPVYEHALRHENPVYASQEGLEEIRKAMAREAFRPEMVRQKLDDEKRRRAADPNISDDKKEMTREEEDAFLEVAKEGELAVQLSSVRHGEIFWRMWMRAALADGPVFKPGTTKEVVDRLSSRRPTEMEKNWAELQKAVDWDISMNPSENQGEFAVKRILHPALFAERQKYGEASMRPYLIYGSHDFLTDFLGESFIKKATNFRDGVGFEAAGVDRNGNRIFEKTHQDGRVERVLYTRNNTFQTDEDPTKSFDFGNVKWEAGGETSYTGTFQAYRLGVADKVREGLLSPGKLARDPYLNNFMELLGHFESFDTIEKAVQNWEAKEGKLSAEDVERKLQDERDNKGKIYRQDVFGLLIHGMLKFQHEHREDRFGEPNITESQMDYALNMLRARGVITEKGFNDLKKGLLRLDNKNLPDFIAEGWINLAIKAHRIHPQGILMVMLMQMMKSIASAK